MEGNILTFEVPRSFFSHTGSLLLQLHLTETKLAAGAKEDDHGSAVWTVRRMMDWMEHIADDKERQGHIRTAETYRATVRRMRKVAPGNGDTLFDASWMSQFDKQLHSDGLTLNTIGFYMKRLRAACNLARESGGPLPEDLFDAVYTGNAQTAKRALDAATVSRLVTMELTKPMQLLARDLFLFSFYTRGMSFIDMAYLQRTNIQHDILTYRRHKTGQRLSMAWLPEMEKIVRVIISVSAPYNKKMCS